jgi:26S proteasome non-ATPase regulatory subunit 9
MGLRMDDIHAPTVASGPTSHAHTNGTEKEPTFQELVARKENLEAELDALGSVLDSVCIIHLGHIIFSTC